VLPSALRLLLLASSLAILAVPSLSMLADRPLLSSTPLEGVVAPAPRPPLRASAAFDETFQRGFTAWFEQGYGARAIGTRLDNSVAYWIFGEIPPDKTVRVGTHGVLFLDQQLNYYNRQDRPDAANFARKARRAQDLLRARGLVLVPMLIPTKTHFWADAVPPAWKLPLPEPRPCVTGIVNPILDAMSAEGVEFVDGQKALADLARENREAVYTRVGRHLTAPAMCRIVESGLALARPRLPQHEIPPLDCAYRMSGDVPLIEEEYDLFRLLNIWTNRTDALAPVMNVVPPRTDTSKLPDTLVMGTSFGWKVVKELERNHAVSGIRYHYYVVRVIDRTTNVDSALPLDSPEWPKTVERHPLLLLPIAEDFLALDAIDFLERVVVHYGAPGSAP